MEDNLWGGRLGIGKITRKTGAKKDLVNTVTLCVHDSQILGISVSVIYEIAFNNCYSSHDKIDNYFVTYAPGQPPLSQTSTWKMALS